MLTQDEAIQKIIEERQRKEGALKSKEEKDGMLDHALTWIARFLDALMDKVLSHTFKSRVVNFPSVQKVSGKVEVLGLPEVKNTLSDVIEATRANKITLPDVQTVSGSVTITNFPESKEIKFPDYPKQIKSDITSLPKYVGETLDEIKKAIKAIEIKPEVKVSAEAPNVSVNLDQEKVIEKLDELGNIFSQLDTTPQVNIDLSSVMNGLVEVKQAILNLKFPVPNFKSSWSHSFDMRANDYGKTYTYTTVGGVKAIQTITTVIEGDTYVKTFGYTSNDAENPDTESAWIKQ